MSFHDVRSRWRSKLLGLLWGSMSLAMATSAAASPIVVVDTGAPSAGVGWILAPTAWLGAEFVVGAPVTITSVEGWMDISIFRDGVGGDLAVNIYTDGGDTPGTLLDSKVVTESGVALVPEWRGATGLDWVLDSGTYWVTFEPSTFIGSLRFPAASPLANYAYSKGANWTGDDTLDFGVRILGDTDIASVPEPASMALLGLGLAALAGRRRKAAPGARA